MDFKFKLLFIFMLICYGKLISQNDPKFDASNIKLENIDGDFLKLNEIIEASADYFVVVFLNDECPICIYYAKKINELDAICSSKGLTLVGVFSGKYKKKNIIEFKNRFSLKPQLYIDKKFTFAKMLHATVTPEIFLISKSDGRILYSGMIDDNFADLGVRKTVISFDYFKDALFSVLNQEQIIIPKTKPVGCMLNY